MNWLILIPLFVSFGLVLLLMPEWIRQAKQAGRVGKDMHKIHRPQVAESGGVVVLAAFVTAVLLYIGLRTFYFKTTEGTTELFALLTTVLIASYIGMIDTLLGWKKGLSKKIRIVLCIFAAIPLMVSNTGQTSVSLPGFGIVNLGLIYTALILPIGVAFVTTTFNFLAGYNGLEARQGILVVGSLSLVAYLTGSPLLALVGGAFVTSLLGFLFFNSYPARVFPGDTLTYAVGAFIAALAVVGNMERFALLVYMPTILEVILKARGRFQKESFAKVLPDGSLTNAYSKWYGLEHIALSCAQRIWKKATEERVVFLITLFQICWCALAFFIYRESLFIT
jgi:UDP-N-acetylglucosamine--dolichyl-phosphate N-acetylglucosaminephosphotransferase